ncbi:hypothetical protein DL95DRAFT_466352 [Leptodontidium sp. 2 PMI_412]|nr:hypothetical protein DL95DRAFT_466352 [Leptodontidium sp. 2 PMI_412]
MERSEKSDGKLRITLDIAPVFGSRWTLPMVANLGALVPTLEEDIIVRAFKANFLTDDDRENSPPLKTKVRAYSSLPEVEQFGKIMRDVYKDFCVEKLRNHIDKAETQLRLAVSFAMNQSLVHQDSALLDCVNKAVEDRLDMGAAVNVQLRKMVGGRAFHDSTVSL